MVRTQSTKRRRYTDEERATVAAADRAIRERTAEALADPDSPELDGLIVAGATGHLSARILGYSLANQLMLWQQADERGITLRDVDTYRGWRERGRGVKRGERGLRIVRPVGREDGDPEATAQPGATQAAPQADEAEARTRFRMMTVFEVSQTDDGADDAEPLTEEPGRDAARWSPDLLDPADDEPPISPAAALATSLVAQLRRGGYAIEWDDTHPEDPTHVDYQARTVRLPSVDTTPDVLRALAAAVAELSTRNARRDPADVENVD
jgi:hypothetical protein